MCKLKKIAMVALMGVAVICATSAMAACPKGQWQNGKKCAACPANATCKNGVNFTCNKNFAQKGNTCIAATCAKGQWMNGSKCAACPANADCKDGKTFTCKKNFAQKGNTCIATTCTKGQWMNGSKCAACPANADCKDGKTFVCKKNFAQKGNTCIAATCTKGQWMNGSKCAACPANADCKDGKTFTCKKNYVQKGNACESTTGGCKSNELWNGYYKKCQKCPAHAICNGTANWKCENGYIADQATHRHADGQIKSGIVGCSKIKSTDPTVTGRVSGSDGQLTCPKGTGLIYDKTTKAYVCKKCPTGGEICGFDQRNGKLMWVNCAKGYHNPYTKKGYDTTRCVKDGQCGWNNPC